MHVKTVMIQLVTVSTHTHTTPITGVQYTGRTMVTGEGMEVWVLVE